MLPRSKAEATEGYLLTNPSSSAHRVLLDVSSLEHLPEVLGPVLAAERTEAKKQALIEVPAMGYAWVGPAAAQGAGSTAARKGKTDSFVADGNMLRNEYFQVTVSRTTGAIQSIVNYAVRGNRLAQQIGMRLTRPGRSPTQEAGAEDEYSIMAADEVAASHDGPMIGRIASRGRLLDREGKRLAGFVETVEARRGSRVLNVTVELETGREPGADPWVSYYAARFAWVNETAELFRGVGLSRQASEESILESPYYLDLRAPRTRFTILTGGLPYHRRFGLRKLDTLLCVRGETARTFRFAIGVNLAHPVPAALHYLAPDAMVSQNAPPPKNPAGWLFHIDAKNVVATAWEPWISSDRALGYRVRLMETEGRPARVGLRSFRTITTARRVNFLGEEAEQLSVEGDKVTVEMGPHQWLQIEAEFTP